MERFLRGSQHLFGEWENDQYVRISKFTGSTPLSNDELEEAERAFAILKSNYIHRGEALCDAVKFFVDHHKHATAKTLEEAFDQWNEVGVKEKNLRPDTIRDRKSSMNGFVQKHGEKSLEFLNQTIIKKFIYKPKISQVTKNGYIRVFKGFFNFCVEQGWLIRSPIGNIKQGKIDQVEPTIFSVEEAKRLVESAERLFEGETLAFFSLMMFAGLRPSEIHDGLLWDARKTGATPLSWENLDMNEESPKVLLRKSKAGSCGNLKSFQIVFIFSKKLRIIL